MRFISSIIILVLLSACNESPKALTEEGKIIPILDNVRERCVNGIVYYYYDSSLTLKVKKNWDIETCNTTHLGVK